VELALNQEDIRGPSDSVLCSVCSQRDVRPFAELRGVPINCTSVYWQETAARSAPRGNIRLGHCMACGAIRNLEFDASRVAYDEAYENSLHFSPAF